MAIDIQAASPIITATGQPVSGPAGGEIDGVNVEAETGTGASLASQIETAEPALVTTEAAPVPVTVDIAPEALRQITSLSATNRRLQAQLKALEAKVAASVAPADVTEKLARLAALEGETPRQYLQRTKKTLEDVAADVLADDIVTDPRVDQALATVEELRKKLEEKDTAGLAAKQAETNAAQAQQLANAQAYVKKIASSNPERWTLIQGKADIEAEIVKAATIVITRDYTDKKTGKFNQPTAEQANEVLNDCLDEAETYELAKKLQAEKKTVVPGQESLVKRKGLEVQADAAYVPDKGSDGKQANGARTPKVTIDANRGAIRQGAVKRGPTDVRTARARMLRIAGAGSDIEE